jgi:hypothetical protein
MSLTIRITMANKAKGAHTASKTYHPARESPNTMAGKQKNIKIKYAIGNHRYLAVSSPRNIANFMGTFLMKGTGYQIIIPDILKYKWQKATCMALGKACPVDAKLANIPVAVVPIFDPKVNGYILSMLSTPIPTNGVRVDVKMELDWTRTVRPAPIKIAR